MSERTPAQEAIAFADAEHVRDCPKCKERLSALLMLWSDGLWSTDGAVDAMAESAAKCKEESK